MCQSGIVSRFVFPQCENNAFIPDMVSLGLILAPMLAYILSGLFWLSSGQLEKEKSVKEGTCAKTDCVVTPRAIVVNAVAAAMLHILPCSFYFFHFNVQINPWLKAHIGGLILYGIPMLLSNDSSDLPHLPHLLLWALLATVAVFSCSITVLSSLNPRVSFTSFSSLRSERDKKSECEWGMIEWGSCCV